MHQDSPYNLGLMALQRNDPAAAVPHFKAALVADPDNPRPWLGLTQTLFVLGELEEVRHWLMMANARRISHPDLSTLNNLLPKPRTAPNANELKTLKQQLAAGQLDQAQQTLYAWMEQYPSDAGTLRLLGLLLIDTGRHQEALAVLQDALALQPGNADTLVYLGMVLHQQARYSEALQHYHQALAISPNHGLAPAHLASTLQQLGRLEQAQNYSIQAQRELPDHPLTWLTSGDIANELGNFDSAWAHYSRAQQLAPQDVISLCRLGRGWTTLGALDQARQCYDQALARYPDAFSAHLGRQELARATADDPAFAYFERNATAPHYSTERRLAAHFMLGKMYDDIADYDRAFTHLDQGHQLRRQHHQHHYQAAKEQALLAFYQQLDAEFFASRRAWGHPDQRMIFVVGFPRSGTSLVEQILASHSQVYGAGELLKIHELAEHCIQKTSDLRYVVQQLNAVQNQHLAEDYLAQIRIRAGDAPRVVDKMPQNFDYLWLIALLFPKATIVHCRRSPLDTCVSCFRHNFRDGHAYSDDLCWLGAYYSRYVQLMQHWHSVLPVPIYDIVYEQLVQDPEREIAQLLDHCGLEFEDACLNFHRTQRITRTASVLQVRNPMYTRSIGHWRNYAAHLQPLIKHLPPVDVTSQ